MDLSLQTFFIVCPLVFLAGLIDSIAGGGGLISLPAYFIAGVPPHSALGTNKLSSSLGTIVSTLRFYKNNYMDLPVAFASVFCAIIGSITGSNFSLLVSENIIQSVIIIVLPFVAFYVLKNKDLEHYAKEELSRCSVYLFSMVASFFIGMYDGFYGPGTGTFLILCYTRLAKMDIKTASGNAKLVNLSSNMGALIVFIANGVIIYPLGLTAALFCIFGHYIGSGLVLKNGQKIVRPLILLILFILFIKIILDISA